MNINEAMGVVVALRDAQFEMDRLREAQAILDRARHDGMIEESLAEKVSAKLADQIDHIRVINTMVDNTHEGTYDRTGAPTVS